jgi:hypothetical protein
MAPDKVKTLQYIGTISRILCGIAATVIIFKSPVFCSDLTVSLTVKERPLGDVLTQLSAKSQYDIEYGPEWQDFPISVRLENESLEAALNRILRELDHAIVLDESNKKISLFIYRAKTSTQRSGRDVGRSPGLNAPRRSVSGEAGGRTHPEKRGRFQEKSKPPSVEHRQIPMNDPPFSISGAESRFDQATRTISE